MVRRDDDKDPGPSGPRHLPSRSEDPPMPPVSSELNAVLAAALAAGDDALAAHTLGELGRQQLAAGDPARALRTLRSAAAHAAPLGEGALGRALGDLGVALV